MSSSSSSSSQEETSDFIPLIRCPHCHSELHLRQSFSAKNPGKYYYGCNKVQDGYAGGCSDPNGFFTWADQVTGTNGDGTPILKLKSAPAKRQRVSAVPRQEAHVGSSSEFMPPGQAAVLLKKVEEFEAHKASLFKKMDEIEAKMTFLITLLQDKRS